MVADHVWVEAVERTRVLVLSVAPLLFYLDERVEMDLQTFRTYCERQTDDVPLYIFDEEFGAEDSPSAELLHDFKIPPYFEEDLFQYLGDERPPFRWLLLGPHRSGSPIHIDPCGTSVLEASSIFNL